MKITKTLFRKNCLQKVKSAPTHNKCYKSSLINNKIDRELRGKKKLKILFYYPLPFEANVLKSLRKFRKKHEIFVPFMEGESFKMVPFRLPLKKKRFGIFEAGNTSRNIKKIDIAIVPAVGVDGNLQRVGFGKGMYDRFFERLKVKPYTIFVQAEYCYTKENICDAYDIACDILITPTKTLKKARVKR